jgi:hypothetical protein
MMVRPRSSARRVVALATATLAATLAGPTVAATAHGGDVPATTDSLSAHQRRVVHNATKRLRTPARAVAAGYIATDACVELPGVGGMGYHYLNPALAGDDVIDPARPEVLVFVPARKGRLRLGAVEYFKADADQDLTTDSDRPSLFGDHDFEGPMPGHEPGMPVHYDKHVWLYKHNPAGQLAPWNPTVHCPSS